MKKIIAKIYINSIATFREDDDYEKNKILTKSREN